jgi:superoxide reductase
METTRREFLRVGLVSGLAAAAASLPALKALAREAAAEQYQQPKDPAHLTTLEALHWPKLTIRKSPVVGKPFELTVQIGQQVHPMLPDHHIEWVEVWAKRKQLERVEFGEPVWMQPIATLTLVAQAHTTLLVRTKCNIHGLWENSIKV